MKKSIIKRSIGIIISLTVILSVLYFSKDIIQNAFKSSENIQETSSQIANDSSNLFEVHMINIGIGDSILIKSNDKAMLIDGGENDVGDKVLSYIKSQNVKKLDYIVASHPHSDHMGGLDYVVNNFDCENIILSTVKESATPTTKTYKDFLFAIKSKKLNVIKAITGKTFNLGDSTIEILGPVKEYEDLNDSSVVLKVTFGNTKFLFTGDIEKTAEQDLIDSGVNLSADFLKIAHHGSSTSTSTKFLKKVNPSFAAISVNFDNKYSHPHIETIRRLELANVKYYLTRNYSVLIFKSDGNNITINNINN